MVKLKQCINRIIKNKNLLKGISTLIGTGILNFIMGAVYSLSTLAVYEISYIKGRGGLIDIFHLTFYWPVEMIFQCISSFFSGSVYKKIGLHLTDLIGGIILLLGYILMYFSVNFFQDLISVILSGIGTGIILYPSTANAIEWFKNGNGLIVGIMEAMISLGSFFFCFLGEKIINNKGVESNDEDNLYDFDTGKKFKDFMLVLIICVLASFILSFLLMIEKKKSDKENYYDFQKENNNNMNMQQNLNNKENINENNNNNKKNENIQKDLIEENKENIEVNENNDSIETNENNESKEEEKNNKIEELIDQNNDKNNNISIINNDETVKNKLQQINNQEIPASHKEMNNENNNQKPQSIKDKEIQKQLKLKQAIKLAIKSKRLTLFIIIIILQIPVGSMAFSLYREIGEYKKIDIKYLQLIGSFSFIFECLSSFVFGLLCDYVSIKTLLFYINAIGTFFGFIYCLSFKNSFAFFLVQILLSFSSGGFYPIKDFFLLKVFPKNIYIELNSYVSLLASVSINVYNFLSYFVLSLIGDKDTGFWILFISFGIFSLAGFILNFFTNEKEINLIERIKK